MAATDADGWGLWGGIARGWACCGRRCTRSVGITPLLIGCSATDRVRRDGTGAARRNGCSATERVQCLVHGLRETDLECVNGEQLSAVVLVVGGGAPDP